MKIYSRILAISGGTVSLSEKKKVPIVGVLWRNSIIEKCFIKFSPTDPKPSEITENVLSLLEEKYFIEKQVKLVFIFNNILAGLGILDINILQEKWKTPIIIITEKEPNEEKILNLLNELHYSGEYSEAFKKNPKNWEQLDGTRLFFLGIGLEKKYTIKRIQEFQRVGHLPEPLRIADLIAKAIPQ